MKITVFVINFYTDLIKFLSLSMNLFCNCSVLKCYRELCLRSTILGRGLQHQKDWEPWVNARMCFTILQFLLSCATLEAARGDSLWQCLHFCLQYLDPFAKLDNKILQFHGPRHSKVKVSCKLDFHHLEHRVLHRRTGSTCQALWRSTAELCAHWAWDIFWYRHMKHVRHSSQNTALREEIVGFVITSCYVWMYLLH